MNRFFLLFLFFPSIIYGQLTENWSDDDFSSNPIWQGDLYKFTIQPEIQSVSLSADAETSEAFISTASDVINNATWSFTVNLKFNPSGSNYAKIYLTANQAAYNNDIEGYYVMIGSLQDEISLWKRKAGNNTKIIDGIDNKLDLSSVSVSVIVERDDIGNWKLQSKVGTEKFIIEGEVFDNELVSSSHFGIYCKYTSTRSDKFSFGSVSALGSAYADTDKPTILSHEIIAGNQIKLIINEPINVSSILNRNFVVSPTMLSPISSNTDYNQINIYFENYLPDNTSGQLLVKEIEDLSGNMINDTTLIYDFQRIKLSNTTIISENKIQLLFSKRINPLEAASYSLKSTTNELVFSEPTIFNDSILRFNSSINFKPNKFYEVQLSNIKAEFGDIIEDTILTIIYRKPERYDIVFSEIMPDPFPNIGLFDAEYIEIYNRCDYPINLENWTIVINGKDALLPKYELPAKGYLALTNKNNEHFCEIERPILGIKSLPTLTNSSGTLVLYNANHIVSDALTYPLYLGDEDFKTDGGWSYERIDANNFQTNGNWSYSVNLDGGTPGILNSVQANNLDNNAPYVKYISIINDHTFELVFNETIDSIGILNNKNIYAENASVTVITIEPTFLDKLQIIFSESLSPNNIYNIEFLTSPVDYAGNILNKRHSLRIGIAEEPDSFDVCINEVLFNPNREGADFVELYNRSEKILNRSEIYLSSLTNGIADALLQIDDKNQLFFPGEYLVISEDTTIIMNQSPIVNPELMNQSRLPSLSNDEGNVAITKNTGEIIDYFEYTDDMHFELLRDKDGVSLERINPNSTTNNANNWHSASSSSGYSTPTMQNSQFTLQINSKDENWIWLEKKEFSPNSDGNEDFLKINYQLQESGWSGTIYIYDKYGRPLKSICDNDLLGTKGFYIWDGTTDNNTKTTVGVYLIFAEFFSGNGEVKKQKLVAVLTAGGRM